MARPGSPIEDIDTPALVIDLDLMEGNIARMAAFLPTRTPIYGPTRKTHKTPVLAHRQIEAGAQGVTCAKLGEAEVHGRGRHPGHPRRQPGPWGASRSTAWSPSHAMRTSSLPRTMKTTCGKSPKRPWPRHPGEHDHRGRRGHAALRRTARGTRVEARAGDRPLPRRHLPRGDGLRGPHHRKPRRRGPVRRVPDFHDDADRDGGLYPGKGPARGSRQRRRYGHLQGHRDLPGGERGAGGVLYPDGRHLSATHP